MGKIREILNLIIFIVVAPGIFILFLFIGEVFFNREKTVFCDVGQGDASYIRTGDGHDILIDGGWDRSVLLCLGTHMPFFDRTIELVAITHPQKDHYGGLLWVVGRYRVENIILPAVDSKDKDYQNLKKEIAEAGITVKILSAGDNINVGEGKLTVLWPVKGWLMANSEKSDKSDAANQILGVRTSERDLNDYSYYFLYEGKTGRVLYTGDGDDKIQGELMKNTRLGKVDILKVPHHGSKYAFGEGFIELVRPQVAVISSGKNSFGHPSQDTIAKLLEKGVKVRLTVKEGDVVIKEGDIF